MRLLNLFFLSFILLLAGCGNPGNNQSTDEADNNTDGNPNQALYDQVMDIHDEVMPKMEDIYKLKSQLQEKIANSPELVKEKKESIERMILQLDSANNAMMIWMRQFNPPDSVDEEQARAYLEEQMEKVKKVKEDMLTAIDRASAESEPK